MFQYVSLPADLAANSSVPVIFWNALVRTFSWETVNTELSCKVSARAVESEHKMLYILSVSEKPGASEDHPSGRFVGEITVTCGSSQVVVNAAGVHGVYHGSPELESVATLTTPLEELDEDLTSSLAIQIERLLQLLNEVSLAAYSRASKRESFD